MDGESGLRQCQTVMPSLGGRRQQAWDLKAFWWHSGGVLYGLYESPAWTHSPIGAWSADPLQYRLRHGPDYEPAVMGSHVARNNRRPIHAHSTRRHDGHRPDISRQMAAGLLRVHLLSQHLPDDAERNRHCTREARCRRRQVKAALHHGRPAARHARSAETIRPVVRSADRRTHWKSAADRRGRQGIRGPTGQPIRLDLARKTTSWTTVPTFTSWTLKANSCAPLTPTRQAIKSPTHCT